MAERRWTDEQLSAIETRDKTLLVSAAAGSGKTATLTERIIRSLTDKENPTDISSLLVVTFTKAAAAELRVKLTRAVEEAANADPENKDLQRQLYMLPSAKIRTIDSFCNDILKANCDRVGLSPSYRLADEAECELLARSILEGLIDAVYAGELPEVSSPECFERLADCLTDSKRTEELGDAFRYVYDKCEAEKDGVDSLLSLIEKLNPESFTAPENSVYGAYLMSEIKAAAEHNVRLYERFEREFALGDDVDKKYLAVVDSDLAIFRAIIRAKGYSEVRDLLIPSRFESLPRGIRKKSDLIESFKEAREETKEILDFTKYFLYTDEEWKTLFSELYELLSVFYRFLKRFDSLYFDEKRRRATLSYADIERLCYNCLIKDGKPTDIAESLRARFSSIYIDEYQDVNDLQNSIFEAISRPNNRFMVGDIKQSIYVFRKAKPEIFASMKAAFPELSEAKGDAATVFMSKNFRCDEGIVDFVNGIFDKAFSLLGESIGYREGDRLGYAKIHKSEPEYFKPEVCLLERRTKAEISEAEVVALKIKELIEEGTLDDGSRIRASDVAIIMRSAKGKANLYSDALERVGIPSKISAGKDFFLTPEVLLTLSLLNSIDNPRKDIYLAGLMCSPLFDFTADDIYKIREEFPEGHLYDALCGYIELNPNYEKGRYFVDRLTYYRAISEGVGVDVLINKLYHETGLFALASKWGGKENLVVLYDYARSYEAGAFKGLYNFINFVNNLSTKRKTEFDDTRDADAPDAVRIITSHSSKGLEYPVVFLADTGTRITNEDAKSRLVYADGFGIAFRLRTPSGLALVDNPVRELINRYNFGKMFEEELRILYVALTRARERLYVTGASLLDSRDKYLEKIRAKRESLDSYSIKKLASFMEIILAAGSSDAASDTYEFIKNVAEEKTEENEETIKNAEISKEIFTKDGENKEITDEFVRRFTYTYPQKHLTLLPEKMSVSRISPTVLDGSDDNAVLLVPESVEKDEEDNEKRHLPKFAIGKEADESAKRGIATHYFMQFCDLELLRKNGAREELSRLVELGFISREDEKRVRLSEIEAFTRSDFFRDMLGAKRLYRELRFNALMPAVMFTENEERISAVSDREVLVQGVIDCIIEFPDGTLGVFDYKTDRLTREELSDRALARESLYNKHSLQLSYYAYAVERMFGKAPVRVEVYSLPLADTVDVKRK